MLRGSNTLLRGLAIALAILSGLSLTSPVLAQDMPRGGPEGLIGLEQTTYTNDEFAVLSLAVFQFGDEDLAATAFDLLVEESASDLGDVEIEVTVRDEVEGLNEVGDDRSVIEAIIEGGVSRHTLIVHDGAYVHVWTLTDVGPALERGGTPDATPNGTPGAGGSPLDLVTELANGWFAEVDDTEALDDQLPPAEFVPEGFEVSSRQDPFLPLPER